MPIDLPEMEPCLFCERLAGRREDWVVIDECELTVTFLNPLQYEIGQACVIPRRHAPLLMDLSDAEAHAVIDAARRLAAAMVEALDPDAVLLYQNNGIDSGQVVPHFHVHVVPRRAGSDWGLGPPHLARAEAAERHARLKTPSDVPEAHRLTGATLRRHLR